MPPGATQLQLDVQQNNTHAFISLSGELDIYTVPLLKQNVTQLLREGCVHLTFELSGIKHFDTPGIGTMRRCQLLAKEVGGQVRLVCEQERLMTILSLYGIPDLFEFVTKDEARAMLQSH